MWSFLKTLVLFYPLGKKIVNSILALNVTHDVHYLRRMHISGFMTVRTIKYNVLKSRIKTIKAVSNIGSNFRARTM